MLVYASNQPEQFDWAVNDRIDEMVPFSLPGKEERLRMINLYMGQYLLDVPGRAKAIKVEGVEDKHLESVAVRTKGFSGREIAKLAIAWQAAAYGTQDSSFGATLMEEVLQAHLQQKQQKQTWFEGAHVKGGVLQTPGNNSVAAATAGTRGGEGGGGSSKEGPADFPVPISPERAAELTGELRSRVESVAGASSAAQGPVGGSGGGDKGSA
ncbi:unnamed protein product [Discosporangium mesarthrocarpum]